MDCDVSCGVVRARTPLCASDRQQLHCHVKACCELSTHMRTDTPESDRWKNILSLLDLASFARTKPRFRQHTSISFIFIPFLLWYIKCTHKYCKHKICILP